ncbi:MAG: ParB/RepB/Spo0J family partition protein [Schwartzia sp.]|nr:ParB/RepB/Spo0J family partition protein [Schwartzia sp. (in: firmicutes)]
MGKKGGLGGQGLGALIKKRTADTKPAETAQKPAPVTAPDDGSLVVEIPVDAIRPNRSQPRKNFDEAALEELAESIRYYGVLQPLLVRALPEGGYELIAGERRLRAAKIAGLHSVPALLRKYTLEEMTEIALIENVQRENLNAVEEAHAYDLLMQKFGLTQEQLSERVGRSRSHIANFLRLLRLPERVQESLAQEVITMGQARPLLALDDPDLMQQAADYIIDHNLSSRQAEVIVARLKKNPDLFRPKERMDAPVQTESLFITDVENRLKMLFGAPVRISLGQRKSKIEISFKTQEDLDRIVDAVQASIEQHEDEVEQTKKKLREVSRRFTT